MHRMPCGCAEVVVVVGEAESAVPHMPLHLRTRAQVKLMGEKSESSPREAERELESITTRLVTLLATLNEAPAIR